MMFFLAKAMHNPNFVQQLVQHNDRRKLELEEATNEKRSWRRISLSSSNVGTDDELGQDMGGATNFVNIEPDDLYHDIAADEFDVSELDKLAMDLQGQVTNWEPKNKELENIEHYGSINKNVDEGFWDDLLNDEDEEHEENVDVLVEQLGYWGSPK
ncbi:hypothetical protein PTKIN_Ptkin10aG0051200 [Pterospermum kingtungense]